MAALLGNSMNLALRPQNALRRSALAAATPRPGRVSVQVQAVSSVFKRNKAPTKPGRPAPKGKAKPQPTKRVPATQFKTSIGKGTKATITLGFTKSNELFVGRLAMLGISTAIIGETITGKGALGQLGLETHLSVTDVGGLILAVIAFNLAAALTPTKGTFVPDEEELSSRPAGALQDASVSLINPKKFFGVKGFGFTKANELFVGRVAQLGFAAALIGEYVTGKGPLAQLGLETGIPLTEAEPLLLASIIFTLFAAVNEGSGKFVDEE